MEPVVQYKEDPNDPEAGNVLLDASARRSIHEVAQKEAAAGMFARFANSFWNPRLDNEVLECEHQRLAFPQTRRRFRIGLGYIVLSSLIWCIYFCINQEEHWIKYASGCVVLIVADLCILAFTFSKAYQRYVFHCSIFIALLLCVFCLLSFIYPETAMSSVGLFTGSMEILLLMYTVVPLPLYICFGIGVIYTIIFETLSAIIVDRDAWPSNTNFVYYTVGRVLLQLCIHLLGVHFFIMSQVRERKTFLKVGQSMLLRRDLEDEKDLKKKMINSLMPEQVAREVIESREEGAKDEASSSPRSRNSRHSNAAHSTEPGQRSSAKLTFRSFHMSQMDNTSILFADIVGFTKMSSNKTAQHLVSLLNDLFGRFDVICEKSGCEKISTLGDCYYCVSGCPKPRADHAKCCVEMGLGMVIAIEEFDRDHNEAVGMRVGVHTGTVLCGLVGTRRFKFDVFSHDVTIANLMESEGKAGLVHVSEPTYELVKHLYDMELGEEIADIRQHKTLIEYYNMSTKEYDIKHVQDEAAIKTWFINGRKSEAAAAASTSPQNATASDTVAIAIENSKNEAKVENGDSCANNENAIPGQASNATLTLLEKRSGSAEEIQEDNDQYLLNRIARGAREEMDKEIVHCMRKDSQVEDYLHNPPINKLTLNFLKRHVESDYRHRYLHAHGEEAVSLPRWSACRDMVVSFCFFVLVAICCFLNFTIRLPWIIFFVLATILQVLLILPHLCDVYFHDRAPSCLLNMGRFFLGWYARHALGALVASVPIAAVYSNFSCHMFEHVLKSDLFYALALIATLLHYCNFTILSSWLKSSLATLSGLVLLILIAIGVCSKYISSEEVESGSALNITEVITNTYDMTTAMYNNGSAQTIIKQKELEEIFTGHHPLKREIILNIFLILVLIWFLNRENEISCRLSYHGDVQAQTDQLEMKEEKEQADWLLHNIIPEHVSDLLKQSSDYSVNHQDVGVVFAKIVNYDDFYDESYEGGKEYLRVLNELMGDFEELFDNPKYKDVEKIKTIGACLMVASGLNPTTRRQNKDPKAHLYALMDFSVELLRKLSDFNAEIFNFNFEMAIGYNFGEVTAGVIGTTKLLYDIWGDTVNVSSRMYSTGVSGKIQLTGACKEKLEGMFDFEYRGQIAVKGKGDLDTFLLVDTKPGASWS